MAVTSPLAAVVGANCKRWRKQLGLTQDKFAEFARMVGLRWTASAVGDFEAGRSSPSLATVIAVGIALQFAFARTEEFNSVASDDDAGKVLMQFAHLEAPTLADLFRTDADWVDVNGVLRPPGEDLSKLFLGGIANYGGNTAEERAALYEMVEEGRKFQAELATRAGVTEKRMARQLGISVTDFMVRSVRLWGRTFTEERDLRAGPDTNQQKKGRVAREMRDEIAADIQKVR